MLEPLTDDDPPRVGPFTLEGRLGAGVFAGRTTDGTTAAVRLVPASWAGDADFRRRVAALGEAVVDSDLDTASPWLATAFVAGPSLRDVVGERGPLPVPEVLRLAAAVADRLVELHAAGLAHGNLKAANVVLAPEGPRLVGVDRPAAAQDLPALGGLVAHLASGEEQGEVPEPLRTLVARCAAGGPAAEIAGHCRAQLADGPAGGETEGGAAAGDGGDPLAYAGVTPPANPLDLSAGIPADAVVGPVPAPGAEEEAAEDPLSYPATDPPANPLDLSTGIPHDSIVGPIPNDAVPEKAEPPGGTVAAAGPDQPVEPVAPAESVAGDADTAPPIDPVDLAALRAAADAIDAAGPPGTPTGARPPDADGAGPADGTRSAHTIEPIAYLDPGDRPAPPSAAAPHRPRRRLLVAGITAAVLVATVVTVPLITDHTTPGTPVAASDSTAPAGAGPETGGPSCAGARKLTAGGSALQRDAMTVIAARWAAQCRGSTLAYTPGGAGFGAEQFAAGETDLAVADHVLGTYDGEIATAAARCAGVGAPADKDLVLQVPLVLTPVVLTYHLPGVTGLRLDAKALSAIFGGRLTRWNHRSIARLNPGIRLPALAIAPIARGDAALSTETLQQFLTAVGGWRSGGGPEFTGKTRRPQASDAGVLAAVRSVEGAIGYLPFPAVQPTGEPVVSLVLGDGTAAAPGSGTVHAAVNAAVDDAVDYTHLPEAIHHAGDNWDGEGTAPYPLVHVGYVVACTQYPDDRTTAAVRDFLLTALGVQVESARGYQLPFGSLRLGLVDLVERTY